MLSFARRFRLIFIRLGLCLIAVVSLAAIVVLLSQSILASAAGAKSKPVATNSHVPALTLKPDSGVGEVQLVSSADELASIERARSQMPSLVNANDAIDWSALTDLDDSELLPTTFEEIDEITLIAGMDPAFADWVPLGGQVAQLASADDSNSGSFGGGGGDTRNGWSGGGGGGAGGLGAMSGGTGGSRLAASLDGSNGFTGVAGDGVDVRSANSPTNAQSGANSTGTNGSANGTNDNANGVATANGAATANGLAGDVPPGLVRSGGPGATSATTTSVPEPSTLLLMAVGLSSLTMSKLRRRRAGR